MSPGTLKVTSAERPSSEIWPSLPLANGDSTSRHVLRGGRAARRRRRPRRGTPGRKPWRRPWPGRAPDSDGLVGERVGDRLVGRARGAVALLLGSEGLGADHAADDEGDRHEREPAEHGRLAVLRGPAPGAGREVGVGQVACPSGPGESRKQACRRRGAAALVGPGVPGCGVPHPAPCGRLPADLLLLEQDDQQDDDDDECAQSDVHSAHVPTPRALARRRYENGLSSALRLIALVAVLDARVRAVRAGAARRPRRSRPRRRP